MGSSRMVDGTSHRMVNPIKAPGDDGMTADCAQAVHRPVASGTALAARSLRMTS